MRHDHAYRERDAAVQDATAASDAGAPARNRSLHPAVLLVGAGAYAWILGVLAVVLGASAEALFVIAISALFLLIYLALPGVMAVLGHAESSRTSLRGFLNRPMELWTGRVPGREAALQVVLLPIALAVGMTAIGIAIAFARASVGG